MASPAAYVASTHFKSPPTSSASPGPSPPPTPSSSIRTVASLDSRVSVSTVATSVDGDSDSVLFGTEPSASRFLQITGIPRGTAHGRLKRSLFSALCQPLASSQAQAQADAQCDAEDHPIKGIFSKYLPQGMAVVAFYDIRDAMQARRACLQGKVRLAVEPQLDGSTGLGCRYMSATDLVGLIGTSDFLSRTDGFLSVVCTRVHARPPDVPGHREHAHLARILGGFGALASFECIHPSDANDGDAHDRVYLVEFNDVRHRDAAAREIDGTEEGGVYIRVGSSHAADSPPSQAYCHPQFSPPLYTAPPAPAPAQAAPTPVPVPSVHLWQHPTAPQAIYALPPSPHHPIPCGHPLAFPDWAYQATSPHLHHLNHIPYAFVPPLPASGAGMPVTLTQGHCSNDVFAYGPNVHVYPHHQAHRAPSYHHAQQYPHPLPNLSTREARRKLVIPSPTSTSGADTPPRTQSSYPPTTHAHAHAPGPGPDPLNNNNVNNNVNNSPEKNQLNLDKIEDGQDTRTTVMIKNIPNKMSSSDLISFISHSHSSSSSSSPSPPRIDFLYLRIDFANGCNVGYAFVNFLSTLDLLLFARSRLGKRWNLYQSEKVLQMSYANYQGKEALVEKFRNSCVMDERREWRPRVFCSEGGNVGEEEVFPGPTHLKRKERSAGNRGTLYVSNHHQYANGNTGMGMGMGIGKKAGWGRKA